MKLTRLTLTNYRCFDELDIHFDDKLTVLIAPNGPCNILVTIITVNVLPQPPLTSATTLSGKERKDASHLVGPR